VRISEAPSYSQTVLTYDPGSTGALAYLTAAREVAYRGAGLPVPDDDAAPAPRRAGHRAEGAEDGAA
jgi:chromosome partitioning protein